MFSFLFSAHFTLAAPCEGPCQTICPRGGSGVGECDAGLQCCKAPAKESGDEQVAGETGYGLSEAAPTVLKKNVDLPAILGTILGSVLGFTATIFFILVIVAGLMWMTSAGNEERVKRAKQILIAAVIGLIIVMSAYAITSFIGSNLAK